MPDGKDAEPLRCSHFPLQIIANHPCIARHNVKRRHRVKIGLFVRLAEARFFLDLNMIKAMCKVKAVNLGALRFRGSVGYERQTQPPLPQLVDDAERIGKKTYLLLSIG